jgi:hypothetical protein
LSVKCYDDAIIARFREVFNDDTISILPVENAIRYIAQLKRDNVTFPLISTMRTGYSIVSSNVNHPAKMIGSFTTRNGENDNISMKITTFAAQLTDEVNAMINQ